MKNKNCEVTTADWVGSFVWIGFASGDAQMPLYDFLSGFIFHNHVGRQKAAPVCVGINQRAAPDHLASPFS